ncbi:hypothetical protein J2TS4_29310 [Paenibacillus sp. J2TS4]|nr:hypothetical protein J2TS4_29310 [Paenibacillus sp. J2TS4]
MLPGRVLALYSYHPKAHPVNKELGLVGVPEKYLESLRSLSSLLGEGVIGCFGVPEK